MLTTASPPTEARASITGSKPLEPSEHFATVAASALLQQSKRLHVHSQLFAPTVSGEAVGECDAPAGSARLLERGLKEAETVGDRDVEAVVVGVGTSAPAD